MNRIRRAAAQLLRRVATRLDNRRPRVCAPCAEGDHADCMIDSPSYVCLCPHTPRPAVVPDGYAQGRADLQLVHGHYEPHPGDPPLIVSGSWEVADGWIPCSLGTITATRPPTGSTRVRFHAEPRGTVEGRLLGLTPSDLSLAHYRIEVGTIDGPREYDLPLSHPIEVSR